MNTAHIDKECIMPTSGLTPCPDCQGTGRQVVTFYDPEGYGEDTKRVKVCLTCNGARHARTHTQ